MANLQNEPNGTFQNIRHDIHRTDMMKRDPKLPDAASEVQTEPGDQVIQEADRIASKFEKSGVG